MEAPAASRGRMAALTAAAALALIALPLAGVRLAGRPVARYLEFPPLTRYVAHAAFAWPAFLALAALLAVVVAPFAARTLRCAARAPAAPPAAAFPWWGWAGLAHGLAWWVLAWTRFPWFAAAQPFTFSPLWFSYILVVNGLTFRRTGGCMLTRDTRRPLSRTDRRPGIFRLDHHIHCCGGNARLRLIRDDDARQQHGMHR